MTRSPVWAVVILTLAAFGALAAFIGVFAALDILPFLIFLAFAVAYMILSAGRRPDGRRRAPREGPPGRPLP